MHGKFSPLHQRAAKGGKQTGVGHSHYFWSLFGTLFLLFSHFLVTILSLFGRLFAYPCLPSPFCGTLITTIGTPKEPLQVSEIVRRTKLNITGQVAVISVCRLG